jgi:hypothetical protein
VRKTIDRPSGDEAIDFLILAIRNKLLKNTDVKYRQKLFEIVDSNRITVKDLLNRVLGVA